MMVANKQVLENVAYIDENSYKVIDTFMPGALTIILKITNTVLLDYQGFGDAAALSGINIFASLYVIKESFLSYFFNFSNGLISSNTGT